MVHVRVTETDNSRAGVSVDCHGYDTGLMQVSALVMAAVMRSAKRRSSQSGVDAKNDVTSNMTFVKVR